MCAETLILPPGACCNLNLQCPPGTHVLNVRSPNSRAILKAMDWVITIPNFCHSLCCLYAFVWPAIALPFCCYKQLFYHAFTACDGLRFSGNKEEIFLFFLSLLLSDTQSPYWESKRDSNWNSVRMIFSPEQVAIWNSWFPKYWESLPSLGGLPVTHSGLRTPSFPCFGAWMPKEDVGACERNPTCQFLLSHRCQNIQQETAGRRKHFSLQLEGAESIMTGGTTAGAGGHHHAAASTEEMFQCSKAGRSAPSDLLSLVGSISEGSTMFSNSATIWGPSVQTHEPVGDISHSNHAVDALVYPQNKENFNFMIEKKNKGRAQKNLTPPFHASFSQQEKVLISPTPFQIEKFYLNPCGFSL